MAPHGTLRGMNEPLSPLDAVRPQPADGQEISRAGLKLVLSNAIEHARSTQRHVAVLIVVLARGDRLEALLGVPTVDIMNRAVKRLPTALRPADHFVRLSDDKICIILPNLKTSTQAWLAATKIQQTLEAPFSFNDTITTIRPVVGIASFPEHADEAEQLVVHADIAKRIARSRDIAQHIFQADDRRDADTYLGVEVPLREAIRANQLEVFYQPQVNLSTGKCHAAEGLLRWTHPDRGVISPPTIIRVAESNGMIGGLTTWVMQTVLRQQAEWRRAGVDLEAGINLSTITLVDTDLPDVLAQAMGTWDTNPAKVTLEITESATIDDVDQSLDVMHRLKKLGARLSVDDFGTGYSSLSYVKNFPLDELKIDKSFIQHMRTSKSDQQIVRSVIDLAHNFELKVVAEGVEDEATFNDLREMGCDLAQGYLMSPALRSADLLNWLKQRG